MKFFRNLFRSLHLDTIIPPVLQSTLLAEAETFVATTVQSVVSHHLGTLTDPIHNSILNSSSNQATTPATPNAATTHTSPQG